VKAEKRRAAPISVQLQVALRQLREAWGVPADTPLDLDHQPPLALRPLSENGTHIPHQHAPEALFFLTKEGHKIKTAGRAGESDLSITYNGDVSKIAKTRRIEKKQTEFIRALLAKASGQKPSAKGTFGQRPKKTKPGQRSASRPIERKSR
jgi:hypothetical protein